MNKIYIVEGIWHVGKSALITSIKKFDNVAGIPEPTHFNAEETLRDQDDIDNWYMQAHMQNLQKAYVLVMQKSINVFIERSVLSSIAFMQAYDTDQADGMKYLNSFIHALDEIRHGTGEQVRIIHQQTHDFHSIIKHVQQHSYLKKFSHKKSIYAYDDILSNLIRHVTVTDHAKIFICPTIEAVNNDMNVHD